MSKISIFDLSQKIDIGRKFSKKKKVCKFYLQKNLYDLGYLRLLIFAEKIFLCLYVENVCCLDLAKKFYHNFSLEKLKIREAIKNHKTIEKIKNHKKFKKTFSKNGGGSSSTEHIICEWG